MVAEAWGPGQEWILGPVDSLTGGDDHPAAAIACFPDAPAAVARTIVAGGALVVEAGTGVGKTFSYLVPALLSGERVLLSTATKTLQDQLFGRDLPRLAQALGLPVRMALLKGRASYLCAHRLELARRDASLPDRAAVRTLAKIDVSFL